MPTDGPLLHGPIQIRAAKILDFEEELQGEITRILRSLRRDILGQLSEATLSNAASRTARVARAQGLLRQINASIEEAYGKVESAAVKGLQEILGAELAWTNSALASALPWSNVGILVNTVTINPDVLRQMAQRTLINFGENGGVAPIAEWFEAQVPKLQAAVSEQVRLGVLRGESIDEISRRLAGGGAHLGVLNGAEDWADAIARTGVNAITADARSEVFRANRQIIKGVYQVSVRDSRTTIQCICYAGRKWQYGRGNVMVPVGHDLPYNGGCPRHIRCRSQDVPWMKSGKEMGLADSEIPKGLRTAFNGEIAPGMDGATILAKGGDERGLAILGRSRYEMFKGGSMKLDDFLDRNGNVIPVGKLNPRSVSKGAAR